MKKTKLKKTKLRKTHKKYSHYKGGAPLCTELSSFPISDASIMNYNSVIPQNASQNDCFINALQILVGLDTICANLMRISSASQTGFDMNQIKKCFILLMGYNFELKLMPDYLTFSNIIKNLLPIGYAVLCGYTTKTYTGSSAGHVFVLARNTNGEIMLLDPQINLICNMSDPICNSYIEAQGREYYILYHSQTKLSQIELQQVGFR